MSENIMRENVTDSPLQKRRRLDAAEGAEQMPGESSGPGPEASSSSTLRSSPANATPVGSPSGSHGITSMLSPIIAPAPELAPPVVTDVSVARSPPQPAEAAEASFVRGTLQDPAVRGIIDNLETLRDQMRAFIAADTTSAVAVETARHLLRNINAMDLVLHEQHKERLSSHRAAARPSAASSSFGVASRALSDLEDIWDEVPVVPSQRLDLEGERRRLSERIQSLNDMATRLYPTSLAVEQLLPVQPLPVMRDPTPTVSSPTVERWTRPELAEDEWSRERRRRRELEHALLDESYSIIPPSMRASPATDTSLLRWGQAASGSRDFASSPPSSATESRIEPRAGSFVSTAPEEDARMRLAYAGRPRTTSTGGWQRWEMDPHYPMDVDSDGEPLTPSGRDSIFPAHVESSAGSPAPATFRSPFESATERRDRAGTPSALSRAATLPGSSALSRPRDARSPLVPPSPVAYFMTRRTGASPVDAPPSSVRSTSIRPLVEESSPDSARTPSRTDDLARRHEMLAMRRAWQQRQAAARRQASSVSRSSSESTRGRVFGEVQSNLPGIHELFSPPSPPAVTPVEGDAPWDRAAYYSPSTAATQRRTLDADEELQDIAETIRLLEDDGAPRSARNARLPPWQPLPRERERLSAFRDRDREHAFDRARREAHRTRTLSMPSTSGDDARAAHATDPARSRAVRERALREATAARRAASTATSAHTLVRMHDHAVHAANIHEDFVRMYHRIHHVGFDGGPRGTPQSVIDGLPGGTYGDWARPGESEEHCPICFDEWTQTDDCLRMPNCTHWFHKPCLVQWLKTARTCPTCRAPVDAAPAPREHTRDVFGRPRMRISTGGLPPQAVRTRALNAAASSSASTSASAPRARETDVPSARRLPPALRIDLSDDDDTVLVERRRRSPWRGHFAPSSPAPAPAAPRREPTPTAASAAPAPRAHSPPGWGIVLPATRPDGGWGTTTRTTAQDGGWGTRTTTQDGGWGASVDAEGGGWGSSAPWRLNLDEGTPRWEQPAWRGPSPDSWNEWSDWASAPDAPAGTGAGASGSRTAGTGAAAGSVAAAAAAAAAAEDEGSGNAAGAEGGAQAERRPVFRRYVRRYWPTGDNPGGWS